MKILLIVLSVLFFPFVLAGAPITIDLHCGLLNDSLSCNNYDFWGLDENCRLAGEVPDGVNDCMVAASGFCRVNDLYATVIKECRQNLSFWTKIKIWFKDMTRRNCANC